MCPAETNREVFGLAGARTFGLSLWYCPYTPVRVRAYRHPPVSPHLSFWKRHVTVKIDSRGSPSISMGS